MKRLFKLSLGIALGATLVAPAMAQDQFPDVPSNHWAYEALENLKREGVLVGYPDMRYRGARLATRYEMAIAINAAYTRLMRMIEGLSDQIEGMSAGDNTELKSQIEALRADVNALKGVNVADLQKLVNEFESELTGLGNDVDEMKERLGALEGRVKALEDVKLPVAISGDINFLVFAGNSRDKRAGMNKEGRLVGVNEKSANAQTGFSRDFNVYHEIAVKLKDNNDSNGLDWHATIAYGNMFGNVNAVGNSGVLADFVNQPGTVGYSDDVQGNFRIDEAAVTFDTSLAGLKFRAEVGRVGLKVAPYIFQRADNTLYFKNDRWDDGRYRHDGAQVAFDFGGVDVALALGRNSDRNTSDNTDLNPIGPVDTTLGAVIGFNIGSFGRLNAAYLYHEIDATTAANAPNRLNVLGFDATGKFGAINVNAGYSKSIMTHNGNNLGMDRLNQAAFAKAGYEASNWGLSAEYRKVQRDFAAAGDWRRIGTNWNPTNIESFTGAGYFNFGSNVKLSAMAEIGQTVEPLGGIPQDSDFESILANLDYKLNDAWTIGLGYEDVRVKLPGQDIRQKWASLGLGYTLGTNALLNFAYEYGSVTVPNAGGWGNAAPGRYTGGFLTSQLTVRF